MTDRDLARDLIRALDQGDEWQRRFWFLWREGVDDGWKLDELGVWQLGDPDAPDDAVFDCDPDGCDEDITERVDAARLGERS